MMGFTESFHSTLEKVTTEVGVPTLGKRPHTFPGSVQKTSALWEFDVAFIVCKVKCLSVRNSSVSSYNPHFQGKMFIVSRECDLHGAERIHYQASSPAGVILPLSKFMWGGRCPELLHHLIGRTDKPSCDRGHILLP